MHGHAFVELQPECKKSTENATILIVEDDPLQLDFLEYGLTSQGFRVLTSLTCDGGFRQARQEQPDVILLDVLLPDGDGLSLCQRIADRPETSDIPVIIISGSDREDIVRESRWAGSQFFLKKPYDPNALLLLIDKSLNQHSEWP